MILLDAFRFKALFMIPGCLRCITWLFADMLDRMHCPVARRGYLSLAKQSLTIETPNYYTQLVFKQNRALGKRSSSILIPYFHLTLSLYKMERDIPKKSWKEHYWHTDILPLWFTTRNIKKCSAITCDPYCNNKPLTRTISNYIEIGGYESNKY